MDEVDAQRALSSAPLAVSQNRKFLRYINPQKAIRNHVATEDWTVNESFTVTRTAITLIFDLFIDMKHSTNLRTTAKALVHGV